MAPKLRKNPSLPTHRQNTGTAPSPRAERANYTLITLFIGLVSMVVLYLLWHSKHNDRTLAKTANKKQFYLDINPDFMLADSDAFSSDAVDCDNILHALQEAYEFDGSRENIRALLNFESAILCTTREMLEKVRSTSAGLYLATAKIIILPNKDISLSTLIHESRHFLHNYRHSTPGCLMPPEFASSQIYLGGKVTKEGEYILDDESQIKLVELQKTLDLGDQRTRIFHSWWIKTLGGKDLSTLKPAEKEQFLVYREAAKSCLISPDTKLSPIKSRAEAEKLKHAPIMHISDDFFEYKVDYAETRNAKTGEFYTTTTVVQPEFTVAQIVPRVQQLLNTHYRKKGIVVETFERVELTLEEFSNIAKDTFYPETMAMIREDEEKCPLPTTKPKPK